jgi:hypothetical protein
MDGDTWQFIDIGASEIDSMAYLENKRFAPAEPLAVAP